MTPQEFIAKWQEVTLSERSACQQHFLDICDLLGQPKSADLDKDGSWYTFERGVDKNDGGKGWADVWMKGHFGWEYKDAILDLTDSEHPAEPEWPEADFIVGNRPFVGGKRILSELGETCTSAMRHIWDSRLPRFSDLCCYWFEKARQQVERKSVGVLGYWRPKESVAALIVSASSESRNPVTYFLPRVTVTGFSMARPFMFQ